MVGSAVSEHVLAVPGEKWLLPDETAGAVVDWLGTYGLEVGGSS